MTYHQAVSYVVAKWLQEHHPKQIMLCLVCLGYPIKTEDVMKIIRRYVDISTENVTIGKKIR
jgi:hypothetical protein